MHTLPSHTLPCSTTTPFLQIQKSVRWKWRLWWRKCRYCWTAQKQPSRGVLKKSCSENMQQIFRRIPVPKCNFNKVGCNFIETALRHERSPVNLLHIFRTPFPKNTSGRLLLYFQLHWNLIAVSCTSYSCSSLKSCFKKMAIFFDMKWESWAPPWLFYNFFY